MSRRLNFDFQLGSGFCSFFPILIFNKASPRSKCHSVATWQENNDQLRRQRKRNCCSQSEAAAHQGRRASKTILWPLSPSASPLSLTSGFSVSHSGGKRGLDVRSEITARDDGEQEESEKLSMTIFSSSCRARSGLMIVEGQ
jgi:hypothetical protein